MSSSSEAALLSPLRDADMITHGLHPPEEFIVKFEKEAPIHTTVIKQCQAAYH